MPTTAALQASISGGANQTGGISAVDGDTCQLSGVSTVGWAMQRFEIYSFPVGFALPAGFTLDAVTGAYYYAASPTCPIFTMTPWGKYLFRLTIGVSSLGLGLDGEGNADPSLVDNTCAVSILSPAGLADLAWNETTQFDPAKKWVKDQAANLRILNAGLGSGPVPNTRTLTAGVGLTGGGNLMADRTFNIGSNADGSIQVNPDDIQVGQLATDLQHGARGGGSQHAVATGGANGFMSSAHYTLVNNAAYAPTVSVIPIRGSSGDILGVWFAPAASGIATTGLLRAANNTTIAAAINAAGTQNILALSTDASDGVSVGDITRTVSVYARASSLFQVTIGAIIPLWVTAKGIGIGGVGDPADGNGAMVSWSECTTEPTTNPSKPLGYVKNGTVKFRSAFGVLTTVAPVGDTAVTEKKLDVACTTLTTTNATPTLFVNIPITSLSVSHFEVLLLARTSDGRSARFKREITVRCDAGATATIMSADTPIVDIDQTTILGTSGAISGSGDHLQITVTGIAATTIHWDATVRVTSFAP